MKTINLNKQENVEFFLYPDNQPHVRIASVKDDDVTVLCSIKSSLDLFNLLAVSNAIDNQRGYKHTLIIPYLLGARSDRVMVDGDSVDLKVVCDLINLMDFENVAFLDVHSDAALHWTRNSHNIDNHFLVREYDRENAVLICPDIGASKKVDKYLKWNTNIKDVAYCLKSRDFSNGKIALKVLEPEKCKDRNCIIIDDLVDRGGTFLAIAGQIQPKNLTLIVTHGIFSGGTSMVEEKFDLIITSDSYALSGWGSGKLKVIAYNI